MVRRRMAMGTPGRLVAKKACQWAFQALSEIADVVVC
jgi:hypothetical protein